MDKEVYKFETIEEAVIIKTKIEMEDILLRKKIDDLNSEIRRIQSEISEITGRRGELECNIRKWSNQVYRQFEMRGLDIIGTDEEYY